MSRRDIVALGTWSYPGGEPVRVEGHLGLCAPDEKPPRAGGGMWPRWFVRYGDGAWVDVGTLDGLDMTPELLASLVQELHAQDAEARARFKVLRALYAAREAWAHLAVNKAAHGHALARGALREHYEGADAARRGREDGVDDGDD